MLSSVVASWLSKCEDMNVWCVCVSLSAIDEVGGVPFEILEPVLERCTPEQLYRIEQSNQVSSKPNLDLYLNCT